MKKYQQLQTKHELVFPRFTGDLPSSPGDHVQEVRLVKKIKCPKQVYHMYHIKSYAPKITKNYGNHHQSIIVIRSTFNSTKLVLCSVMCIVNESFAS